MPLPVVDLPQDRSGAGAAASGADYAEAKRSVDSAPSLERLGAAVLALLFKYTQEEELALGIIRPGANAGKPQLHLLHVTDSGHQSLASLEGLAGAASSAPALAADHEAWQGLQVFVAEQGACAEAKSGSRAELRLAVGPGTISWRYRRAMYTEAWVDRAHGHLLRLLASDAKATLTDVSLLSEDDTVQVLHKFNQTSVASNPPPSVLHGVEAAAKTWPVRKAVRKGKEAVTYAELWAMAGELGDAIAKAAEKAGGGAHPVGPGVVGPVAVLLERGMPMVVALLAAWRAGGACMPLDLKTPRQRLEHMLGEAAVKVAVTSAAAREQLSWLPCTVLTVDDFLVTGNTASSTSPAAVVCKEPALEGSSVAYVLFTSGSTGLPKGVLLTHTNLLAYIGWHTVYYQLGPDDRVPHMAGLSFDASMAEIWPTLCSGGCVLPPPDDEVRLMPEALCRWYADAGATVAFLTTQLAEAVLQEPAYPQQLKLRTLFTGGDKLHFGPSSHAPFKLVNIYGPTECTVNVTMCLVPTGSGPPPIGEPVAGAQLYVVDPQMRPQPVGVYGELYIGGQQVGAGYLGKPDLTAERFVDNPFAGLTSPAKAAGPTCWPTGPAWQGRAGPAGGGGGSPRGRGVSVRSLELCPVQHGPKLYRTGDLVRWTEDGSVDFLGRADCQVKIRGQRIELGEIEARLLQHEAVKECCVICRTVPNGHDKYLAAYWTKDRSASEKAGTVELSAWLRTALPEYMVPKVMIELPKLPVNANGKVDRRALPEPELPSAEGEGADGEPQEASNSFEGQLQSIFEKVLGRGPVPLTVSFFELGGHSLSVGQLVNRVRRELHIQAALADVYAAPSVRALAIALQGRAAEKEAAPPAQALPDDYPATFQQAALYGMSQVSNEASTALNLSFCCYVRGPLDVKRLQGAFTAISMRHDALRTTFHDEASQVAFTASGPTCVVQSGDCLDFQQVEAPADISEWLLDEQYRPFNLHGGPLCRVRVSMDPSSSVWVLHWTLHHVSSDLWSYNVLLSELALAYEQLKSSPEVSWPSPAPQYRACAAEQAACLESAAGKRSFEYWASKLDPAPPKLELPTDRRAPGQTFAGSKVDFEFEAELHAALGEVARLCGATSAYPVLLAAWMLLLSRHAQEEDVCVGTPMACRTTPDSEAAVGYFVNPLCVRATVAGSFQTLVRQVVQDVHESLQHQLVPLATVCEKLGLEERKVLQGMFVFQTCPSEAYAPVLPSFFMGHEGAVLPFGSELKLESMSLGQRHAQFDIVLMLARGPSGQLIGSFQYNSACFSRGAVLNLQSQFYRVVKAVVEDPLQDVGLVQLFGAEEVGQLQRRAISPWPRELPQKSLPELFVERACANPSAFAVVSAEGTVTFGEVLRSAEMLARTLMQRRSVVMGAEAAALAAPANAAASSSSAAGPRGNPLVGLMVNPGKWTVAGPLGAWLAGRGYFPLDPGHPIERLQHMVKDASPQYVVCERQHQAVAQALGFPVLVVEDLTRGRLDSDLRRDSAVHEWPCLPPDGRALLVFTSGSTGRPKGVLLSIQNLLTHVLFCSEHFNFKPGQAVLQHTAWTFDAPICEMWPALLAGATVVTSKRDGSKDFDYIVSLVNEHRVSHGLFVPSLLAEVLEHQYLPRSLRSLVVVGEACSLSLAKRILEAPLTLHNFYGPSEAGIGATIYDIDKIGNVPSISQTVPIGRPVSWRQVVLLDTQLRPAVGRAGQLAIMGEGLALGYLNLPEETRKKFVPTPQEVRDVLPQCGSTMYLTGDVGRFCQDDLLEFVGRLDNQVKLRGQRIELGEVEEALLSAPAVTEAVAVVYSDRLIAYFSTLQGIEEGEAVAQCVEKTRQRLPRYMWPELVHIQEWPRGRTGKVDRKALPVPTFSVQDTVAPRTPLEANLLALFCQALRRDPGVTSVHSDFFSLGGTSLRAATLLTMLRAQVPEAANLQFNELYAHPSPSDLAAVLAAGRETTMKLAPAPAEGLLPASLGQEHMLVLHELQPQSAAYNSPLLLRLTGQVDRAALAAAFAKVVARHDVLRSNLLRDTIDGAPSVVQVTTPAAEFAFDMQYWPGPPDQAGRGPIRMGLSSRRRLTSDGQQEPRSRFFSRGSNRTHSPLASPRNSISRIFRAASGSGTPVRYDSPGSSSIFGRRRGGSSSSARRASPRTYTGYASPPLNTPPMREGEIEIVEESLSVHFESASSVLGCTIGSFPEAASSITTWLMEEIKRPFDLRDEALIRVVLAKVANGTHLLLINMHHSVTDGRSMAVLRQELTTAYNAQVQGQEPQLPALSLQYADYAYWQRQWMAQGHMGRQLEHWRAQLEGLPTLQLPTDFPRPAQLPLDGAEVSLEFPTGLASRLRGLARARGSTLFGVLLGAFATALGRHGNASDVAIASVVANRGAPELEPLIGYFVNTLIFRARLGGSFEQLLGQLKETTVGAFANSSAPYAAVLDAAKLDSAAVPAMFVLQDADDGKWAMSDLTVEATSLPRTSALFDVTCELQEDLDGGGALKGGLVYNTALWTQTRAARFADSLLTLAQAVLEEPSVQLAALPALPEGDRVQVLRWGGHNHRYEVAKGCVSEMWEHLVQHTQRPAVIFGETTVTYEEFGRSVAALAREVKRHVRTASEPVVGVLLPRSLEMAVAVWAVLSAEAAYVPIDPEYPAERITHILDNAKPQLMLCANEHVSLGGGVEALTTESWPAPSDAPIEALAQEFRQAPPEQLAYVIYTSGSTGRPKGVAVEHAAVANMVKEQIRLMDITPEARVLQFFKPAFDGAVQEYLSTLCAGAALVLWDSDQGFADVIQQKGVTTATLTPSALAVLDSLRLPRLSAVAVAAEACPPALASAWAFEGRRLINAYGPSEGCVVSTYGELTGDMHQVPIGLPLRNVQCYVFEPSLCRSLQPVGVSGELCIGGVQLARGYYGDKRKTEEKFITNPLDGSRMYRSGDLVTWLPCGQLLYMGRNDEMVKVRGFRVELTEVEGALAAAGAQTVTVSLNPSGDALWAWVTPETLSAGHLRNELQQSLPQYMVPQRIFTLRELPLTPNGKIDKRRLLANASAEEGVAEEEQEYVAPRSNLERKVCGVVCAVLGQEQLSVAADLKSSGLSSLKSVMLAQRLRDAGFDVPLGTLYSLHTVEDITDFVAQEHRPESFLLDSGLSCSGAAAQTHLCTERLRSCRRASSSGAVGLTWLLLRMAAWMWISGVAVWPAVLPLWFASRVALPAGLHWALLWLVLAAYPLYLLGLALLVVATKWVVVGRYQAATVPIDSMAFLRWWAVDRLLTFAGDLALGAFRGGPLYFLYLRALGLRANGYSRIDTRFISELDLISMGRYCVVSEGAKLRPAVIEAGMLHLRPMVFGNHCAVGENAVCTSGCATGDHVTLQPLSFLSGRTGRTLPDGSVWKGAPLVQSRQQPIRAPFGILWKDLVCDIVALLVSLALLLASAAVAYCVFGVLAVAQGMSWEWQQQAEGWLFAPAWLLFGPPVMVAADVLLGLDLAACADLAAQQLGDSRWVFGLRVAAMIMLSFAAYGWTLTLSSAFLCRWARGSRNKNEPAFQVRRMILRLTFPRYPAQLSGTAAMAGYLRLLGGHVALSATVNVPEPPLEPRKLHVSEGAVFMGAQALGECTVGKRSLVGGGAVMLPHTEIEAGALVGAMTVAGRPVRTGTQLGGNPGVITPRSELSRAPPITWARQLIRQAVRYTYPVLAPMLLQFLLLVTLLPAMYVLTVMMNALPGQSGAGGLVLLSLALAPSYVVLGWCLALVAVLFKWLLLGRVQAGGPWRWYGSWQHHVAAFVQSLYGLTVGVYMGMAFGSPLYNWWLRLLGSRVAADALILAPVTDFDVVTIGQGAVVDKDALVSGQRLLPVKGGPEEFCTCFGMVSVGARSTISHSAALVAAETAELSVLAPLSVLGTSQRLPARTLAVGAPPQRFTWSKERDNLVKPSSRPVPGELKPPVVLPAYLSRALSRLKVRSEAAASPEQLTALVTGASGFLGRFLVATLLEATDGRVLCMVRAKDHAAAKVRVLDSLRKAGVHSPALTDRIEAIAGDLSQRNLGLPFVDFQGLASRVTHVFNAAAKVNLTEPFELMRKDNVDATEHLLEFCCAVRPKPLHHISTMGVLTPGMLNRHGVVPESEPLGDIRLLPLYGMGDQANGYPYSKWLAEMLVFEAGRQGLPVFVHRPGLIGGHSETGVMAEDVFYHFLSDVVRLREVPSMEGNKFNLTPVDWVAKSIVQIATAPEWAGAAGGTFHPAASSNTVTMDTVCNVLRDMGYAGLHWVDFARWRSKILANPETFKSWSFCASLTAEGDGIDSMAGSASGGKAMRQMVGEEAWGNFDPAVCLERMLRYCQSTGLLPAPAAEDTADAAASPRPLPGAQGNLDGLAISARQPLLRSAVRPQGAGAGGGAAV